MYRADAADVDAVTALALELWPGHDKNELREELRTLLGSREGAVFLAEAQGQRMGFAQVQLRHDYVEGTDSSPVGYLEGIYIRQAFRGHGLARALLQACEAWARAQGCAEFASDCELDNAVSAAFHAHVGFREANRIICFTKRQ